MFSLKITTSQSWVNTVLCDFDSFLQDHAACERKASSMAMSMLAHYADKADIVRAMADLALEELHHFRQVLKLMLARGISLPPDTRDPYILQLRKHIRTGREHYFLDRLLTASIIEARGCERFGLVAEFVKDDELKKFYQTITLSEARHYELFIELAEHYFSKSEINQRLMQLLDIEKDIVDNLALRAALH